MRNSEAQSSKKTLAKISQKKEAKKRQKPLNDPGQTEYRFLIHDAYVQLTHLK